MISGLELAPAQLKRRSVVNSTPTAKGRREIVLSAGLTQPGLFWRSYELLSCLISLCDASYGTN